MPLFSNKFSPKAIPVRKQETAVLRKEFGNEFASRELNIDSRGIKLRCGNCELAFEDERWIAVSDNTVTIHKENATLKKALDQMQEENNMLRLKFEVLIDMVTELQIETLSQVNEKDTFQSTSQIHNSHKTQLK